MIKLYSIFIFMIILTACSRDKKVTDRMVDFKKEKVANQEQMAAYLNSMIKKNPKNPDLYLKLTELNLELNKIAEAEDALNSYETLKGNDQQADFLKAKIALKLGNNRRALHISEELFLNGFESIELHELLFYLYYDSKESLKAIDQINYAILMNPANQEYYYNKAICYMQNRDTVNAIISLETAFGMAMILLKPLPSMSIYWWPLMIRIKPLKQSIRGLKSNLKILISIHHLPVY